LEGREGIQQRFLPTTISTGNEGAKMNLSAQKQPLFPVESPLRFGVSALFSTGNEGD